MPMPIAYGDMPKILMFGYNSPTKQPYLAQFPVDIKLEPSQSYFCDGPILPVVTACVKMIEVREEI